MDIQEEQYIASKRGKWSQMGVPHKGCVDIEDLGEPQLTCQMCESQIIRYVHYMEHPKHSEVLCVGCVCAGHMEGDITAARNREASMRSRIEKRKRWTTRKWKISAKGNPWIRSDGYRIIVYQKGTGWSATVSTEDNSSVQHCRKIYPTQERAKLSAFDHVTRLLSKKENS
ncbi:MAG: hypothetical protein HY210_01475 [Candidatus Omnitrophica bacterium]|nr:hypothetical protein [Candidatus Omnitrophota bacterium]